MPKTGGPYAFAREGLGEYMGFQTAYCYWVSLWVGNAGLVVALNGYLHVFFPVMNNPKISCLVGIAITWLITFINLGGMSATGATQIVTTILKFVPFALAIPIGFYFFHHEYITEYFNVTTKSNFGAFSYAATLTLWAFIGLESASVPADSVDNPKRNIPLATIIGVLVAALIYILSSVAIMGTLPPAALANSSSPFAAAIGMVFGKWGQYIVAAGAIIACLGSFSGMVMITGQVSMAAADDRMFPKIFAKRNSMGVPAVGLIISSALMSILLIFTSNPNLVDQFQFIILIASVTALLAYIYTAIAEIILLNKAGKSKYKKTHIVIALLALIYSFWAFFGSGFNIVFYVCMLLFSSLPIYTWVVWRKDKHSIL
jgi:APA family basic amino acid/polyamine antiporter